MSSLKFDFHTVCSDCWGLDCDLETHCIVCADVSDNAMSDYVAHKLSLKYKLLAKRKLKTLLPHSVVGPEPVVVAGDQPPVKPCVLPTIVTSAPVSIAQNQSSVDIVSQVNQFVPTEYLPSE